MTVETDLDRAQYATNATTGPWTVPFYFLLSDEIAVTYTDATGTDIPLTLNVDYSVSGAGSAGGGTVTTTQAYAAGGQLVILRDVAALQETEYVEGDSFPAKTHERALDRLTMLVQQLREKSRRSITLGPTDSTSGQLPAAAARAGLLLGFDGSGQPTVLAGPLASSPVIATTRREPQTASAAQTVFTLATMSYASATPASVLVVVDGLVLPQSEYTQTSPTRVTLNTALVGGEQVEFIAGNFTSLSSGSFAAAHTTSGATDVGSFQFRRNVEYAGGTPGFVNSAVRIDTYVDNAAATAFEWGLTSVIQNKATAGQNVAIYGQGNKLSGAGPTWAGVFEAVDSSGGNPTSGCLGLEVDIRGDNGDSGNNRIGIDVVATRTTGSVAASMSAAYGLRFQTNNDATVSYGALIGAAAGVHAGFGIDFSGGVFSGGAIKIPQGSPILFDVSLTPVKALGSALGFDVALGNTLTNRLLNTGGLQVFSAQVVGPRVTGWAAPTGTLSRATFDQSTVTLPLLAQRVAALITDLTTHGLIGA